MGRNVLVVTTAAHPEDGLREALGEDVDALVVVSPVVRLSRLDWLTNDEDGERERAERIAAATAAVTPGETVDARAGDHDPFQAVLDALRTFPADEVVVVTRPDERASWLEQGRGVKAVEEIEGVPVRHLELT